MIPPHLASIAEAALVELLALSGLFGSPPGSQRAGETKRKVYFHLMLTCLALAASWFLGALM